MNPFKLIFNMLHLKSKDFTKSCEAIGDGKVHNGSSNNQQCIITKDITDSTIIQYQYINKQRYAGPIIDQKINENVEILLKSRFYTEFDTAEASVALIYKLIDGELSGGNDAVRSRAIAWCSRLLSLTDLDIAEKNLRVAKKIGDCSEIKIAEAFICSQKDDKQTALKLLADLNIPLAYSAALMIIANHEGVREAIEWLDIVGISAQDLDSDGRFFLLTLHLQLENWDNARSCLDVITDEDLCKTPALNHIVAMIYLISAVPKELRTVVLNQVPFQAADFPLAADQAAMEARRKAHQFFMIATEMALRLNCPNSAKTFDEFVLWLGLKDPSQSKQEKERLREKLRDTKSALRLVHLALQFGIKLDLKQVEDEMDRQIALHGGITLDTAIARFALAFTHKKPEDVANYIARHREQLNKYIDNKYLQFLEIDMLSQAKMSDRAEECLNNLKKEGLSKSEESRLRRIIAEIEGTNPIEACKEQFKKTDAFADLQILVEELEARGEWFDLCIYGEIIFARTHSLRDAERLATALNKTQKYKQLIEFLRANSEFLTQSPNLHMFYCWALYYEGSLLEARIELEKLSDDPNYHILQVNIGIASGDWNSLISFVAKEYMEKEKRSAQELIGAAQLAHYLRSPFAKDLTFAAVEKGSVNADVLATAYFLATSAGWESSVEVSQWLNKAAELSGDNGPIQKKSLKDLLDMNPDWVNRELKTWESLSCGDIPMFIAGKSLNRSLIHLMLFPALTNLSENDPRRRGVVPAYSGKRLATPLKSLEVVAMDATVLLTLAFLKLLDKALDAFGSVYIPHSTLNWLFEEKQKAAFHQPSRVRDAHQLQRLFAMGFLEKLNPNTVTDSELAIQIGDELALLIAEAKQASAGDTHQHIVVCSYPVHKVTSFMEEEVDLSEYADILSSCQAIVGKLRGKGQITVEEEKKANAYLQFQEKPWPNQPEITDSAMLYLDDLAITYFQHLGLLEKLKSAGFKLIVSPRKLSEMNQLSSYEYISDKINDAIEQIRSAVNVRLESGKVKIGRRHTIAEQEEQSISRHPTVEIIALVNECETIFVDDRFINQHASINNSSRQTSIFSTLDLIDILVELGSITAEDRLEYRTLLRRAGYFFVPVSDYELTHHLAASIVKDGKIIETAELKAIRESILCVRMNSWLQIPKEALWLDMFFKTLIQVLKGLWLNKSDILSIRVRSKWILNFLDVRCWAHFLGEESEFSTAEMAYGAYVLLLILPPSDVSPEIKNEYWKWLEDEVLNPIKERNQSLYFWIIDWQQKKFADIINRNLSEGMKL